MKTKKFNLNWQSILLGMALCMVLVVFMGSKAAAPQVGSAQGTIQKPATIMDVWEKTNAMEAKIIAMDEKLIRMEQKIDALTKDMDIVLRVLKRIDKQ